MSFLVGQIIKNSSSLSFGTTLPILVLRFLCEFEACPSASTRGGLHRSSSTWVASMKVRDEPTSSARKVAASLSSSPRQHTHVLQCLAQLFRSAGAPGSVRHFGFWASLVFHHSACPTNPSPSIPHSFQDHTEPTSAKSWSTSPAR